MPLSITMEQRLCTNRPEKLWIHVTKHHLPNIRKAGIVVLIRLGQRSLMDSFFYIKIK